MTALLDAAVALAIAVVAHELAHLVAARLVGHRVFELHIGVGPSWVTRVGDVDVTVGMVPIGGHVQTGAPDLAGFRWRSAVVAGAGVVANAVLLGVGVVTGFAALVTFNVLAIAGNLWPGRRRRLGDATSDGRTLLDLLRGDADAIAEEKSAWFCVAAERARAEGRLDDAAALVDRGTEAVGPTRALLAVRGVVAFEQRRFGDVVDAYAQLIDDERVTVAGRAGFAADAAWSASISPDPRFRHLAEPWAAFARAVRPNATRRRVVHALALVDADRPDDALDVIDGVVDPAAAAIRVLAQLRLGRRRDAVAHWTAEARAQLSADHPLHVRVETEIGSPN